MPQFIEEEIKEKSKNPNEHSRMTLLIGYSRDESVIRELVSDVDGEILETLPYETIKCSVPETSLSQLIKHPDIDTLELDSGMETLRGN